jgi:hypothetical protein
MKLKRLLVSIFLTLVLVVYLLKQINIGDIFSLASLLSFKVLFVGFLIYSLTYFFRSVRLLLLYKENLNLFSSFRIISIQNMLNQILPFKSGEFSMVYLLRKKGIGISEGVAGLLFLRILDFFSVIFILIFSLIATGWFFVNNFLFLIILSFLLFLFLVVTLIRPRFVFYPFIRLFGLLGFYRFLFFVKVKKNIINVIYSLENYSKNKAFFGFLFVSFLVWGSSLGFSYYLLHHLGFNINFFYLTGALAFVYLFNSLPLHGLLNFGTQEAFWSLVFIAVGVDKTLAISSGFLVHSLVIIYFSILGLFSLI